MCTMRMDRRLLVGFPVPLPLPSVPARSRGQGGAPSWRNDLDRGEHRRRMVGGGTGYGATVAVRVR